jgi:hypothetical protein
MLISEIFYSVQGEGTLVGVPSVFVRTSGCNLRCRWCDTPYASWKPEGTEMSVEELLQVVNAHPTRFVVVTGGELESVSAVVHACCALLRPLTWQHLFLPVLPAGLLDYVSAPMPLLIGVLAPAYAAVLRLKLPVEHLVVLNCDTAALEGAAADVEELPPALLHKLETSLEQGAGAGAVAQLMSRILGSYKSHIHSCRASALPDGALVSGHRFFDHAAWAGQSRTLARFRNALRHSQHFEAFICDQMATAQLSPPAAFSGTVETAAHRMADMLSSARSSYKSLRDAESENNGPRASSGRSWLQRRPLAPTNALEAAPPAAKPSAAVVDGEKDRALVEAAITCWQRNVSLPLREAAQQTAVLAGAALAEQKQHGCTHASQDQVQYELAVLRGERDMAISQRDSLLRERDELLAVVAAALNPFDAPELPVAPAVAELLAPLQARLIAVTTERDLLAAERAAYKCYDGAGSVAK